MKIKNLLKKDFKLILKDKLNIIFYIMPLILIIIIKIFSPSFMNSSSKLLLMNNIDKEIKTELQKYYDIKEYDDEENLIKRINSFDDIIGIKYENSQIKILVQGNEDPLIKNQLNNILSHIQNERQINIETSSLGIENNQILNMITSLSILLVIGIPGVSMGFLMVEDKESKMIEAYSVSPLNLKIYMIEKIIFASIISVILGIISQIILIGFNFNYLEFIYILILGTLLSITVGIIIGTIADNQNSAIAISKTIIFIFIMLPMIAVILPQKIQYFFYILPGYWVYNIILSGINETMINSFSSFIIALILHILVIIAMIPKMSKEFKLKV